LNAILCFVDTLTLFANTLACARVSNAMHIILALRADTLSDKATQRVIVNV